MGARSGDVAGDEVRRLRSGGGVGGVDDGEGVVEGGEGAVDGWLEERVVGAAEEEGLCGGASARASVR